MDTTGITFFIVFGIVILIVFLLKSYYSKKAVVKRKLKIAETKRISEIRDNEFAKIIGKVQIVGEPLIAPLSKRPCAYYYVHVEKQVQSGKSSHWKTIVEQEISGSFVISDGVNNACIDSRQVKSYLVEDRKYNSGFLEDATPDLEDFLHKYGESSENMLGFNKTIRYKEGILEQDEAIALFGEAKWKDAQEVHLPESYGRLLAFCSTPNEPVYLSDDPEVLVKNDNKI